MRHPRPSRRFSAALRRTLFPGAEIMRSMALLAALLALTGSAGALGEDPATPKSTGEEQRDREGAANGESRLRVTSTESSSQKIRIVIDGDESGDPDELESDQEEGKPRDGFNIRVHPTRRADTDDQVALGHDIRVAEGDVVSGNVVCILGSARIDGTVRGDVVVIGGDAEVGSTGLVRGEAIAIGGGAVRVGSGGIVEGEAIAVGGRVHLAEDALVGERVQISFVPSFGPRFGISGLLWLGFLAHLVLVGCIGWILLSLSRRRSAAAMATLRARGWEALLAGVGGAIVYHIFAVPLLLLLAAVLVAIVIGIPLVPVLVLLVLIFPVPGYLVTASLLGLSTTGTSARLVPEASTVGAASSSPPEGLVRAYFLGHFLLSLPGLIGLLLGLLAGGLGLVSKSFLLLSFAVINLAIALGWGAILLSRFGRRWPAISA